MLVIEDKNGRQPAHLAAMRNHRNILEFLYDAGVDIDNDSPDEQGKLPIHYAAQHGGKHRQKTIIRFGWSIKIILSF